VPAWTISPSLNFARAKSLASLSVSNVLVARGLRLLSNVPRLCTSKVTYQVYGICHPKMAHLEMSRAPGQAGIATQSRPTSGIGDKAVPVSFDVGAAENNAVRSARLI
jgi:hypothetical protein